MQAVASGVAGGGLGAGGGEVGGKGGVGLFGGLPGGFCFGGFPVGLIRERVGARAQELEGSTGQDVEEHVGPQLVQGPDVAVGFGGPGDAVDAVFGGGGPVGGQVLSGQPGGVVTVGADVDPPVGHALLVPLLRQRRVGLDSPHRQAGLQLGRGQPLRLGQQRFGDGAGGVIGSNSRAFLMVQARW